MTPGMTSRVAFLFLASEVAGWLFLVPSILTLPTFLYLNGLAVGMFLVAVASAAQGLPGSSVAQLLHDVEHDTPPHRVGR